jgi:hypothetical protein
MSTTDKITEITTLILNDKQFSNDIKNSLDNMMRDGKIDLTDVPEMIHLVTLGYNKSKKFSVTFNQLPELLTNLALRIIEKYDLIPDELQDDFKKILQSSINLILLSPRIKKMCCC